MSKDLARDASHLMDDGHVRYLLDLLHKRIDDLEAHLAVLRETDQLAVRVAHDEVKERMMGFPQEYAKKPEMDAVRDTLIRLERDAISRGLYEERHAALQKLVAELDRNKMNQGEFDTFVENYRIEIERTAESARAIAGALASGTAARQGAASTWKLQASLIAIGVTVLGFIIVVANYVSAH